MKENPILQEIKEGINSGSISLNRYTFLEPISIAHLAVATKEDNRIINLPDCTGNAASFLSRLNFFDYVGIPDPIGNNIYTGNNKNTIEVNDANNSNNAVFDKVKEILINEPSENVDTIDRLLAELITNVEMYASFGVVVGQVINRVLHLAIVDRGPGIATQLRTASQYSHLTELDAILESLKKDVTSGRGRGFGLWQTYEVISRNQGSLLVRTENHIVDGVNKVGYPAITPWLGTSIELRYNLDKPVDFGDILALQNPSGATYDFGF